MSPPRLLVTCEHGGNQVPREYRPLFRGHGSLLRSHRGYDAGSLRMARELAGHFRATLLHSETTRLLVDLNLDNLEGVIVGKALYDGKVTFAELAAETR